MWQVGDLVAYPGPDDDVGMLYRGHPGYVWHVDEWAKVFIVGFAEGPSIEFSSLDTFQTLDRSEYERRVRRLTEELHPVDERPVPRFTLPDDLPEHPPPPD